MTNEFPIFIDFEASSLDLIMSYPIEVGICLANGEVHSWLIKPHVIWQDWSLKAARIHGISQEELQENGTDIQEVAEKLNVLLAGKELYCDAWTFDSFWLHRLYKAAKMKPSFHLESISVLLNEDQVSHWQDVHDKAIAEVNLVRHRAANDAVILHETWKRLHTK